MGLAARAIAEKIAAGAIEALMDADVAKQLQELNETMRSLATVMRGQSTLQKRVVYRGTHGSVRDCSKNPDPLTQPWPEISARMSSHFNAPNGWRNIEAHGQHTRELLGSFGVLYMDTFVSTSYRPAGGRMTNGAAANCNHFCLPGPIDDWSRLLLAFLT